MNTREEVGRACSHCRRQIDQTAEFCKFCGTRVVFHRVLSIGKREDNDIILDDPRVSRYHAILIRLEGNSLTIRDLGSKNGTYLDGRRIESAAVHPNSRIMVGPCPLNLEVIESGGMERPWLLVGKDPRNDVQLEEPSVSRFHLAARRAPEGFILVDLGSTNGTYVNGDAINWAEASVEDTVRLGRVKLNLEALGSAPQPNADTHGTVLDVVPVELEKTLITIGRSPDNDVIVDHPQASKRHAHLLREGDHYLIEDLGSHNGTFINGVRLKGRARVAPTDQVKVGGFLLSIDSSGLTRSTFRGGTVLQAADLTKAVKTSSGSKTLIDELSLTIYSQELVALMGPAGAGKTTLMMCLNGYSKPSRGHATLNGLDIYENYESFRGNIGYVPQEDIIHKELTVGEALYYTAKLRLPKDTIDEEITSLIGRWLDELDIRDAQDVLIGDGTQEMKGISGGQRKRVNLCMELLTEPDVLFLDEPTSGLDHINTRGVMRILRRLADSGRAVILTIHQPAEEFYRLTDNLILLERGGKIIYYGPSADAKGYFAERSAVPSDDTNPAEYVFEALKAKEDPDFFKKNYQRSSQFDEYVLGRKRVPTQAKGGKKTVPRRPGLRQWMILTRRYCRVKRRDRTNLAILLIQAPIVGVLILLAFGVGGDPDPTKALFFLAVSAVWFGCSNSAREIVSERAIYFRERMVNLKIPSYVLSKVSLLALISAFQCVVLVGIPYRFIGVSGDLSNFALLTGVLTLASIGGLALGLVLSSLVKSSEAAIALVPIVMIPQIVLGGGILPLKDMSETTEAVAGLTVTRWAFEAAMIIESPETMESVPVPELIVPDRNRDHHQQASGEIRMTQRDTTVRWVDEIGVDTNNLETDLIALGLLGLSFLSLVFALLRSKDIQ